MRLILGKTPLKVYSNLNNGEKTFISSIQRIKRKEKKVSAIFLPSTSVVYGWMKRLGRNHHDNGDKNVTNQQSETVVLYT